jgi:hypothetical protein
LRTGANCGSPGVKSPSDLFPICSDEKMRLYQK